eukprot:TRINITY_DN17566_c0_g1_i1.p1 TRINITY_DN17566_c0_g1~~TRINITY_DN17566_c0_g1_i1.p1  ORF type:complete len:333 (-),score=79.70 TRINITY_DN17566_c0_g1_i1:35-889(-)
MDEIFNNQQFLINNISDKKNPRGFYFYHGKGDQELDSFQEDIHAFQIGRVDKNELELRSKYLELIDSSSEFIQHGGIKWGEHSDYKVRMQRIFDEKSQIADILFKSLSEVLDIDLISFHTLKDYTLEFKKYVPIIKQENEKCNNVVEHPKTYEYQQNNSTFGLNITDELNQSQELRLKPHKDLSTITLLCQDNIGEDYLQVFTDNKWTSINEVPNGMSMVVNCGDILELMTQDNHKLMSCIHRVVSDKHNPKNRMSSVLFCTPNYDCEIKKDTETVYFGDLIPF